MGRSSKIRHRRRRRAGQSLRSESRELAQALGQALSELITAPRRFPLGMTPQPAPKGSYVIVDPCGGLPKAR